ncbi:MULTISPECIES: ABC transporter ATP-binding protein [Clostridium]|uniref:Galactose/methyl galactoside import ATP-binding protein MglA n=1 Tax=Clostridium carnis TaxID=1530 RepID=A0ABY6SRU3_9CLOT|nr:ABC transporter ATP-binding protein [Clostridium carnis]CAI3610550.1 Guanosine ABC transporter, ATPase component [Clostridium neonatale]CAI3630059.1 Guanosine ABC transporter, ATPase component [Clostridium neonatale]CAI3630541.1 Guanosine ABC transporter, ATPase component [Clostridium neonatale]CAI3646514.1 Guanosine ABC transporter, ATPase component [Clostridium neonatale]CAI3687637.1 Guanosine ABC transporter, ATPase component [Clostridium neonatale]
MEYVVEMLNIRKEFPGIVANDNITLRLKKGEVHALLGENGAGKSTLMSILFGMYVPEQGIIKVRGKEVKISNPNVANELGIGMVHQHFKLVHNFTVTQNIILGSEPKKGLVVDVKSAAKKIEELSKKYGLNVDPYAKIEDISVGMQQRVEILKMLYRDAEVLILDEPTAVLTPQEIDELMKIIKNLIVEGKSIIIITHKLKEIKAVADKCTVIRRGKYIGTVDVKETSEAKMAEMMVGRPVSFEVKKEDKKPGNVILKLENVSVMNNKKVLGLKNFSLEVKSGEVLGIAGVEGNGQTELVEAITGMRSIASGKIFFKNEDITNISIRKRINSGIAHIPEDRQKRGLVLDYTMENNMVLEIYNREPFSKRGLLNKKAIHEYAEKIINEFDVRSGQGGASIARGLSGGNQQKAIIGREIELDPELLIAVQPTRGLDVGSIEYIHKRLIEQRDAGKAVLLVSLELSEILNLSDRIAIVNNGELIGIVNAKETNENEVGLMMAGVKGGEKSE